LLRIVTGAHNDDICIIQYSYELSLIVTGTVSGEIAIYDYEKSTLLDFCVAHDDQITGLHFLWPYPILLSTSLDSQVCLWKVRSVGEANRTV
jgi:WD40 repeat protein